MNQEIASRLTKAAEVWGVEVTRTEILDVLVDEATKTSQRLQLNADRERRAAIARKMHPPNENQECKRLKKLFKPSYAHVHLQK